MTAAKRGQPDPRDFSARAWRIIMGQIRLSPFLATPALAQCAMCRANTAGLDARGLGALNSGILVLLIPPVLLVGAIFFIAFRRPGPGP